MKSPWPVQHLNPCPWNQEMVKYRAAILSFLKPTALYFTMSDIVHSQTIYSTAWRMPEMRPNGLTFSESYPKCDHCQPRLNFLFSGGNSIKVDIDHLMHEFSLYNDLLSTYCADTQCSV